MDNLDCITLPEETISQTHNEKEPFTVKVKVSYSTDVWYNCLLSELLPHATQGSAVM